MTINYVTIIPKTRSSMNISRRFIQITILFFVIIRISLHFYFRRKSVPTDTTSSAQKEIQHSSSNKTPISETADDTIYSTTAPLFYHISPGSSGSRTLYHATCKLGFPSVHHISFCISNTRGIHGVNNTVVQGIRSHYEIMRLYEMAISCCRQYQKGGIHVVEGVVVSTKNNETSLESELCNTNLDDWRNEIYQHLTNVINSGIVGLFDSPYPYLADQVLELSNKYRVIPPIIAMTNRESNSWARSRLKHQILLCRAEFSYEQLGASEFNIFGCIDRAFNYSSSVEKEGESSAKLYFWNVFQYQSPTLDKPNVNVDSELQKGMARQYDHFKEIYTTKGDYVPDMFGMKNESGPISDKQVEVDIRKYILGDTRYSIENKDIKKYQSEWQETYKPNTINCRGRVKWHVKNDSMVELYHLPKTCATPSKSKYIPVVPLITEGGTNQKK